LRQRQMRAAFGDRAGQAMQSGLSAGQVGAAYQPDGSLSQARQDVLRKTSSYAGTPYQLGGRTARGIDCSGLVMSVYSQAGFDVSQHSAGWQGRNIPGVRTAVSNLRPGDIVAWKDGSHIAVYAGNGQIWDASRNRGTTLRPLWAPQNQVYGIAVKLPGE
jgi:cell wall-associated NlpC family hydrolase